MVVTLLVIAGLGLAVAAFFLFRIPDRVVVEKMIRFGEVQPDTERLITDRQKVRTFAYAVRFARKQPGRVDIPHPPYRFTLGGGRLYYLWVNEQSGTGTLMKLPDTGTTYRISEARASRLKEILKKEYGELPGS